MDRIVKRQYEKLFSMLNLSNADADSLKNLIMARNLITDHFEANEMLRKGAFVTVDVEYMPGKTRTQRVESPDFRKNWPDQVPALTADVDYQVRQLLGNENYEIYDEYRMSLRFRKMMEDIKIEMESSNTPFTQETEEPLVHTFYESNPQYQMISGELKAAPIMEEAGKFLDSNQLEIVRVFLGKKTEASTKIREAVEKATRGTPRG
jgi:hypothetical protein